VMLAAHPHHCLSAACLQEVAEPLDQPSQLLEGAGPDDWLMFEQASEVLCKGAGLWELPRFEDT